MITEPIIMQTMSELPSMKAMMLIGIPAGITALVGSALLWHYATTFPDYNSKSSFAYFVC